MSRPAFHSVFADEIDQYLDYKITSGFSEKSFSIILKSFDGFAPGAKLKAFPLPALMQMPGQKNGKKKQRHPTMPGSTRSKTF